MGKAGREMVEGEGESRLETGKGRRQKANSNLFTVDVQAHEVIVYFVYHLPPDLNR